MTVAQPHPRAPRILRGRWTEPAAKTLAHAAGRPLRALARERRPAVEEPERLSPGDPPPTEGRLLLLYDGGCGICLHVRDLFAAIDGGKHLTHDKITRHDQGLLRDVPEERRYESWHVVHPDGHIDDGAAGLTAVVEQLPGGSVLATPLRRFPGTADRAYRWFATNRGWISRGSGLIDHPERDAREQLENPHHGEVV